MLAQKVSNIVVVYTENGKIQGKEKQEGESES